MARKFNVATAAGTFDHFHKGHESFLLGAFAFADTIYIGIANDVFAKSKRQVDEISSYTHRKRDVETFLKTKGLLGRTHIIELHDIYGPTLEKGCTIEAIIVTHKTRYGAELINKLRKQKGLSILPIEEISYVNAEDGSDLSSSRIREGEIDRHGKLFIRREWLEKDIRLPEELRTQLQRPIGELIKGREEDLNEAVDVIKQQLSPVILGRSEATTPESDSGQARMTNVLIVTVGDIVAQSFNAGELQMDLAVVDYQVKREKKFKNLSEIGFSKKEPDVTVENPKGTLTGETFQAVNDAFSRHPELGSGSYEMPKLVRHDNKKPLVIRVIGEEDLATLAVVLAAPLGTHVFYGQPNEGIVQVVVSEEKKAEVKNIVSQFQSSSS